MTKERMDDVLAAFEHFGWTRLSSQECAFCSEDPYALGDEQIVWGLSRGSTETILRLEFHAFGSLGQRTNRLADILYCLHPASGEKLMFHNRRTHQWRQAVPRFVATVTEKATVRGA